MRRPRRSSFKRSALAAGSVVAATSLLLAGCGSKATETDAANAESCVDTSGPTVKVGSLNSLSGTMAISEVTVRDAIKLAVEEINAAGGVLGKQIEPSARTAPPTPTFAEKAEKLIKQRQGRGGLRRLDLGEPQGDAAGLRGATRRCCIYPVQYEGLEQSPNIFYTGATTNQQIVPGAGLPQGEGREVALPGRQRLRLPAHREQDHQGVRRRPTASRSWARTTPRSAPPTSPRSSTRSQASNADAVFNTLNGDSNVAFFKRVQERRA